GRLAEWPGRILYGQQGPMGPLCPRHRQRLPRRARCMPAGRARRWPLFGPGRGQGPERRCVHHRRLVQVWMFGWYSGYTARTLVDPADGGRHHALTQADPAPLEEAVVEMSIVE